MPLAEHVVASIGQVEQIVVDRILALNDEPETSSEFDQDVTKGIWKESQQALIVAGEAHARGHLAFNVFAESGRNSGQSRDRDMVDTISDVVVLFMYHINPGSQIADARKATEASQAIVAAVLALPQQLVVFDVVNSWRPATIAGGEWLLITMNFTAQFDLSIL